MKKYYSYLCYLLRHIHYVRRACWGQGLWWRGLVHDASKFLPDEFIPYANHFYGTSIQPKTESSSESGYRKPVMTGETEFDLAWCRHIHRNPHHSQHYRLLMDDGTGTALEMPLQDVQEMLCDWWGASMAQGKQGRCQQWYEQHRDKLQLHPNTRAYVEAHILDGPSPARWIQS